MLVQTLRCDSCRFRMRLAIVPSSTFFARLIGGGSSPISNMMLFEPNGESGRDSAGVTSLKADVDAMANPIRSEVSGTGAYTGLRPVGFLRGPFDVVEALSTLPSRLPLPLRIG